MGSQFGLVHVSGQFGNMRAVIDNGKGRVHLSKTVTKTQIMHDDAFETTRENMSEFGGAALGAKSLRKCLGSRIQGFGERFLGARLNGMMRRILAFGTGVGGQRSIDIAANAHLLHNFDLNRAEPFDGRFKAVYTLSPNADRNTVDLDIPVLDTGLDLRKPRGTTHFRMFLSIGLLSDIEFSTTDNKYVPFDGTLNGLNAFVETAVFPTRGVGAPTSLQLSASIAGLPLVPVGVSLVASVGIEFIRQIGSQNTLMGSGNAMKIDTLY